MLLRRTLALLLATAGPLAAQSPDSARIRASPPGSGRPRVHDSWLERDLVPGAQFTAVVQSPDGYLWIGTTAGLFRFDGTRAVPVGGKTGDSVQSAWILSLIRANDGTMWAGTLRHGLLHVVNGVATQWTTTRGVPGTQVNAVYQDRTGTIWVGSTLGMCRIAGDRCQRVGPSGAPALAFGTDWDGRLLVGAYGLYRLDGDTLAAVPGLSRQVYRINRIMTDTGGVAWLGTTAGLVRLSRPETNAGVPQMRVFTTADGLASNYVLAMRRAPDGDLWVGTLGGGIAVLHDGQFTTIDETRDLSDNRVNDLLVDEEGDVWAATSGGLDDFHAGAIRTFARADGLFDPFVWAVAGDDAGNVWLTTNSGGITRFDGRHFQTWRDDPSLATGRIRVIAPLSNGTVWFGGRRGTVGRLVNGRVQNFGGRPGAPTGDIVSILPLPDSGVLLGGTEGLFRLDNGRFTSVALPGDSSDRSVRVLTRSTDGTIWAAGNSLYRIRNGAARMEGGPGTFRATPVTAILADSGMLWLSTGGAGLRLFAHDTLYSLAGASPIMLDDAFALEDDAHGGLWMASSFGLQRVSKRDLIAAAHGQHAGIDVRSFAKADGLQSTEFNSSGGSSGWRAPNGRLWFAGSNGLVEVDPPAIQPPASPPRARVEALIADGRRLPTVGAVTLPTGARQIEVDFTSLRFRSVRQLRFRYRLLGFDTTWVDAGPRRSAYYTSLPGGAYEFQVTARDDAGVWNPQPATVTFRAVPPFVDTRGFLLLLAALGLGATVGLMRLRERAVHRRAERLAAEVADRTADLRQQIANRERAEQALREAHDGLEHRVAERTDDLARANDELRFNQERLALVLRQLPALVWTTDLELRVVSAMGSGLSGIGLEQGELVGRTFGEVVEDPALATVLSDAHRESLAGRQVQHQTSFRGHVFEWRVEPMTDGSRITGAIGFAFDVTERAKLREQILQAQKMDSIGRLAGGVAHDLNNILTAVLGFVELSREAAGASGLGANLDEIRTAAERAGALTSQLLTFARRQKTTVRPLDLNRMLAELDALLRRLLAVDVDFTVEPGRDVPPVLADPTQIEQVIVNLAVNARDAMPDGGRLTVSTANVVLTEPHGDCPAGRYARLSVTDTGTGMTEEVQRHAFEPFFTTKELGKGTGLGLATCFGIVREFGGFVEIDSAVGRGTTMHAYLPATDQKPSRTVRSPDAKPRAVDGETLLVAEDEEQVRLFVLRALESLGYRVLVGEDGEAALRVAREHQGPIHLLLADLRMPHMGGYDLAAKLHEVRPETRILFMSGYADSTPPTDDPAIVQAPRLTKPFRLSLLAQAVRDLLDGAPVTVA